MRGVDILIMIDKDSLASTPTGVAEWVAAGGQRNATISEKNEALDVTTKDGGAGAYEYEYGLYGWSISADGVYSPSQEAFTLLKKAMRSRKKIKVRVSEAGSPTEEGEAIITSFDTEAPYDDSATYSMEFQGTGFLTEVTAP